jgi:hypothetical protein
MIDLLLEVMEGDVVLAFKVVEDGAFRDAGLAGNSLGRRGVKALGLEKAQGGAHDAFADLLLVPGAPPRGARFRSAGLWLRPRF